MEQADLDYVEKITRISGAGSASLPTAIIRDLIEEIKNLRKQDNYQRGFAGGILSCAVYIEGGTPKAWDYQHPSNPNVRWEPNPEEQLLIDLANQFREAANKHIERHNL